MRCLEEIIATNAAESGISVEENLRIAKENQFIKWNERSQDDSIEASALDHAEMASGSAENTSC